MEINNLLRGAFASEILEKCGLDWKVEKEPMVLLDGTVTPFFGVVRQDTRTVLSSCKAGYTPFQNNELAEMLVRLSEKTGYEIHGGGLFNGGGKVYIQLKSPNRINTIGEDKTAVNGFLTGINSHDGSSSLKWGETNITISCKNTFHAAMRQIKNSVRHTVSIHDLVERAITEVADVVAQEKSLFDQFIRMSSAPMERNHVLKVVREVTGVDASKPSSKLQEDYSKIAVNKATDLLESIASETGSKGQTLWGLFSGVTHWTNHKMSAPKRENGKLESLYTGTGFEINNKAFSSVMALLQ